MFSQKLSLHILYGINTAVVEKIEFTFVNYYFAIDIVFWDIEIKFVCSKNYTKIRIIIISIDECYYIYIYLSI